MKGEDFSTNVRDSARVYVCANYQLIAYLDYLWFDILSITLTLSDTVFNHYWSNALAPCQDSWPETHTCSHYMFKKLFLLPLQNVKRSIYLYYIYKRQPTLNYEKRGIECVFAETYSLNNFYWVRTVLYSVILFYIQTHIII